MRSLLVQALTCATGLLATHSALAQVVTNAGFESPGLAANSYVYCTGMSPGQQSAFVWTGTGGAVLQNNSATWGLAPAPGGQQAIAMFGVSSVSQLVYFPTSGFYQLTWRQASREGDVNPIWVQMDGVNVQQFATANPAWTTNSCRLVISTTGNHTIGFAGTASFQTVGLDTVELAFVPYQQWQRAELSFTAAGTYTNAVTQVSLTTRFTGPSNQVYDVPGFWDGSNTWRVRFAPPASGGWAFSNICNMADAGLAPQSGSIAVDPAGGTNALYQHGGFLKVAPNKHYLTYTDGTPFFWLADTCWFSPGNLTPIDGGTSTQYVTASMFKQWVNQRKSQRFNVLQLAFIGTLGPNNSSPQTQMTSGTIDPAYWEQVDRYLNYAIDAGMVPAVNLDTWIYDLPNFTTNQFLFIWRYFVARYGAHPVTFLIAGEYNSDAANLTNDLVKVNAIGTMLKQIDPYQRVFTVHPGYYSIDGREAWNWPWYGFIMRQGGHDGHGQVPPTWIYNQGWNADMPVIEGEANYEGIWGGSANVVLAADVRGPAYHAIQAGAAGFSYGAQGLWYPTQSTNDQTMVSTFGKMEPWWKALYFPGATNMSHLRGFYESIPWWKLQPRPGGVNVQGGPLPDAKQPLAKSDGDTQFVVWFPLGSGQNVATTLKLCVINGAGSYTGLWFNPQTGQNTAIVAPLPATNGVCPLPSRPDTNDWVLLLNAVANAAPTRLRATPGYRMAWLQWNSSLGATNYLVKRGVNPGGPYTSFSSLGETSYTDTNLNNGATYYYLVSALSAAGESPNSGEVSAVPTTTVVVGNPSFELTATNTYSGNGWNTLPQPGAWVGGGNPFDTLKPLIGGHFAGVPSGTNCCYLGGSGPVFQDFPVAINAGVRVTLTFAQGRASSYLGTNSSSLTATVRVGNQSWTTNISDAAMSPGSWRTNTIPIVPTMSGNLQIAFTNLAGNAFIDDVRLTVLPAAPEISVSVVSNALVLGWGLSGEAYQLMSTSNLVPPVVWTPESIALQTNAQGISASVPIGSGTRFFRLVVP